MKRALPLLGILLALTVPFAQAQTAPKVLAAPTASVVKPALALAASSPTQHQTTLTWTASSDAAGTAGTTANVYDVAGGCPTALLTSSFTLLASNVPSSGPYVDLAVTAGKTKSYVVTNVIGGVETGVSNCVSATTPTFQPQGLSATAQ